MGKPVLSLVEIRERIDSEQLLGARIDPVIERDSTRAVVAEIKTILEQARPESQVCWIHSDETIFGPALVQQGISLERLTFLKTKDLRAALESALRSQLFCGVVLDGAPGVQETERRRWRLLAKRAGARVIVVNTAHAKPS